MARRRFRRTRRFKRRTNYGRRRITKTWRGRRTFRGRTKFSRLRRTVRAIRRRMDMRPLSYTANFDYDMSLDGAGKNFVNVYYPYQSIEEKAPNGTDAMRLNDNIKVMTSWYKCRINFPYFNGVYKLCLRFVTGRIFEAVPNVYTAEQLRDILFNPNTNSGTYTPDLGMRNVSNTKNFKIITDKTYWLKPYTKITTVPAAAGDTFIGDSRTNAAYQWSVFRKPKWKGQIRYNVNDASEIGFGQYFMLWWGAYYTPNGQVAANADIEGSTDPHLWFTGKFNYSSM